MDQLTSKQISEWEAYDRLDPIGTWRDDYRLAFLSSLVTNLTISVHGKKEAKHSLPIDFMIDWDIDTSKEKEIKKQTPEEILAIFKGIAKEHNREFKLDNNKPPKRLQPNKTKGL